MSSWWAHNEFIIGWFGEISLSMPKLSDIFVSRHVTYAYYNWTIWINQSLDVYTQIFRHFCIYPCYWHILQSNYLNSSDFWTSAVKMWSSVDHHRHCAVQATCFPLITWAWLMIKGIALICLQLEYYWWHGPTSGMQQYKPQPLTKIHVLVAQA
jgi:hypothetical protein